MIRETRSRVRVVHVSSAHPWSDNRVHLREAASLASAGYDVHLVAVEHDVEVPETCVTVHQLRARARLSRLVLGSIEAVVRAMRLRPKIVHLHDPELAWAVLPLRLLGRVVIYDAHEDLPAQVRDKHYLPPRTRSAFVALARLFVWMADRGSAVVAATEAIADTFANDHVQVVHNYPRLRAGERVTDPLTRPSAVVYIGALSEERGSVELIDTLASQAFPAGWTAVVAGTATPPSLLDELQQRPGWDRVAFHGQVGPAAARDLLLTGRVGMVTFHRTPAFLESLPTKMFEYFADGLPVVVSDFPLWRSIIERYDCGQLVDETDPDAIADAVRRYAEDDALLQRHATNAIEAARILNWDNEEQVLVTLYDELSGVGEPSRRKGRG